MYNSNMQYPSTANANLYPVPPPVSGFPAATNYGDYTYYDGTSWIAGDTQIKLGGFAGETNQGNNATALGYFAGTNNQGAESVAIGHNAGNNNQASGTIILNATGAAFNGISGQADSFYVDPIRYYAYENTFAPLGYNSATKEVAWALSRNGLHTCTAGTTQTISIPGLTVNGFVSLTYLHPGAGGAGQWFKSSVPTADTLTVELGQNATTAESIVWIVGKL
jgi:hypothetical protein